MFKIFKKGTNKMPTIKDKVYDLIDLKMREERIKQLKIQYQDAIKRRSGSLLVAILTEYTTFKIDYKEIIKDTRRSGSLLVAILTEYTTFKIDYKEIIKDIYNKQFDNYDEYVWIMYYLSLNNKTVEIIREVHKYAYHRNNESSDFFG